MKKRGILFSLVNIDSKRKKSMTDENRPVPIRFPIWKDYTFKEVFSVERLFRTRITGSGLDVRHTGKGTSTYNLIHAQRRIIIYVCTGDPSGYHQRVCFISSHIRDLNVEADDGSNAFVHVIQREVIRLNKGAAGTLRCGTVR